MKKLIGLILVIGALGIGWFAWNQRQPAEGNFTAKDLKIRSIGKDNETDYAVSFAIHFHKKDLVPRDVVQFEGVLTEYTKADQGFVTEWKSIAKYIDEGQIASDAAKRGIMGKQSLSTMKGEELTHNLPADFPEAFLRTELMILDRLFLKAPILSNMVVTRDELDDQVPIIAEYSYAKEEDLTIVRKKWAGYKNQGSSVDPKLHTITYYFDGNQQLLGAQGQVKSYFKDNGESELVIDFSAKSIDTRPVSDRLKSIQKGNFAAADAERIKDADVRTAAAAGVSFAEALKRLDAVTDKTDGGKYYETFRALTDQVRAHPEYNEQLAKRILDLKARDPSSRRQLSAMFGALAESRNTEGADTLVGLAKDCPDNYCKVQALMGVNTHAKPSPANADALLEISRTSPDKEVAATAVIAAGAVGRKLEGESTDLSKELLKTYNDPARAALKTSTIAAMGNHGSGDYWPTLSAGLKSEDSAVRSASVYSLRYLPNDEVTPTLLSVIDKEPITSVVSEALKASGYRKLSADDYTHIANRAAEFKNKELAEQAANLLIESYRTNPANAQAALGILKEKTKYVDVKTYIEEQMKPQAPAQN